MRSRARTGMNSSSSRSHAIFTVHVHEPQSLDVQEGEAAQLVTKVSFVDLAGSERQARTGNQGTRLRESGAINESLRVLGAALKALCFNQAHELSGRQMRVPYRDSKVPSNTVHTPCDMCGQRCVVKPVFVVCFATHVYPFTVDTHIPGHSAWLWAAGAVCERQSRREGP